MTVAEREEKRRLTKIKDLTYFTEARNHFFDRLSSYTGKQSILCSENPGWDTIRKCVMWTYGECLVTHMPDDKKEEANKFAIQLIDQMYDKLEEQEVEQ